jgi:tripartite-type tricarboxylate transporter receptor subunit TctC
MYNAIKPDGLTICLAQAETLAYNKIWDLPQAKYEPDKFSFLARVVWEESCTLTNTKSPYKSLEDLRKADVIKAACPGLEDKSGTSVSSSFYAFGLKNLKKVVGYGGSREALAAVLKGEADIAPGFSVGGILRFVKGGKLRPLWVDSTKRHPKLPDTPAVFELNIIKGQDGPLSLYVESLKLGRVIIAPPGIPQGRLGFLAGAVAEAIKDPGYGKGLKKMKRDEPRFLEGDKTRDLMKKIVGISNEEKKELRKVVFELGAK